MCHATKRPAILNNKHIRADEGFTCMRPGNKLVREDESGVYVKCDDGRHYVYKFERPENMDLLAGFDAPVYDVNPVAPPTAVPDLPRPEPTDTTHDREPGQTPWEAYANPATDTPHLVDTEKKAQTVASWIVENTEPGEFADVRAIKTYTDDLEDAHRVKLWSGARFVNYTVNTVARLLIERDGGVFLTREQVRRG